MELVENPHSRDNSRDELGRFRKGFSGHPSGRAKRDEASILAQAAFEADPVAVVKALAAKLRKGDIQAFTALANRAYGEMPKTSVLTGDIDVNVSAKRTRLAEVLALLGDAS